MFELLLIMLERLGIIVTVAFIMTRFAFIRKMIHFHAITRIQLVLVTLMFGVFGMIGTYTGVNFSTSSLQYIHWTYNLSEQEALANSRVIGIVIGGLLGGWRVGLGAGLIAGIHRFSLGGFTGFACGISAVFAGLLAGWVHHRMVKNGQLKLGIGFATGMLAEAIQMLVILLVAKPFSAAFVLVEHIGVPMILANGVGTALFIMIIQNVMREEERIGAAQAQKALRLAELTIAHMRKGLKPGPAKATCEILYGSVGASAVAITDRERILAHVGMAADHHQADSKILTAATHRTLREGALVVASQEEIRCHHPGCPLGAAVIAPLKQKGETIGTLKFYFRYPKDISHLVLELIKGISSLLSYQLEISEGERHHRLAREAEIKALQAQVSPHFLFNAINTIVSLIRTDPGKARKLLVSLSHFFRQNLTGTTLTWGTLETELAQIRSYLAIEEARFVDKLQVRYEVDEAVLHVQLPPLTLQPIVENAIKHGIGDMEKGCQIRIRIEDHGENVWIGIEDNGAGMESERQSQLFAQPLESKSGTGMGLYNVNRRLEMMLGPEAGLRVKSEPGSGTLIYFEIAKQREVTEGEHTSLDRG
ncbi:LytS/YhcK type 5TM receptor domain-containing protein [Ammoniphilus sp. 3BR4]|uniref:LytS/YhcK type 5TM receptor domain-containing protein n=1 Tax=Ammoniphilus sp. 3BR4 TaxID=3158265 RepID=UPI003466CEF9